MLSELIIIVAGSLATLTSLSSQHATVRYYVRTTLYFATLILLSFVAFPVILVMAAIGRRYDANMVIARLFYTVASRLLCIDIEVEGAEHLTTNPAIFVGNHQSAVDILYLESSQVVVQSWPKPS